MILVVKPEKMFVEKEATGPINGQIHQNSLKIYIVNYMVNMEKIYGHIQQL